MKKKYKLQSKKQKSKKADDSALEEVEVLRQGKGIPNFSCMRKECQI